jgi:SAM-dependent methyltransferase
VEFSSFAPLSFFRPAGSDFYERFYENIFRAYDSFDALPEKWRAAKALHAAWLAGRVKESACGASPRVLSFGCGLGYVEYELLRMLPDCELHVSEPGGACMRWIRAFIPPQRIHAGAGIDALPPEFRFDLIYLSAADYFLRCDELTALLRDLRGRLRPGEGGGLILLSASLQEDEGFVSGLVHWGAVSTYALLHLAGIRRRQFWGWLRTRGEYAACMRGAGFADVREGRLDDRERTFWMTGA